MSDLAALDATVEMLLDIRDVYAEWEAARDAWYNPDDFKNPDNLERYETAKRALQDKRAYWKGIRDYMAATSTTVAAPLADKEAVFATAQPVAVEG